MNQLSEVCRTCLMSSKSLKPLDTEYEEGCSWKLMLTTFCTLQMDDISVIYDNICKDCSSEILRAYNFKLQCEQNDLVLRDKARNLKLENFYKREAIDISIVKKEVDTGSRYYSDENKDDVRVKDEKWVLEKNDRKESDDDENRDSDDSGESDDGDHRESDVDDDDNDSGDCKSRDKSSKSKKNLKKKKALESYRRSAVKRKAATEKPVKRKCGRKKKPIPEEKAQLIDHSFQRLGYRRIYECYKCGNLCKSFNMIYKHLEKLHDIVLKCVEEFDEMCVQERKARGIQESGGKEEVKDVKFDTKNPMYKCIECPHRCRDFDLMKKHIIDQHREAKFIRCAEEDCQYSTHDLRHLVQHIKLMHRTERRYSCDKCDYKNQSKYVMDLHYTNKHLNIKPFVCHLCAKGFRAKQGLQNHILVRHEKERKYICPICSKGFSIPGYLKEHIKTHSGLKPHICEHCGAAFTSKPNLDRHVIITHSSIQPETAPCPQCSFKAKNIYSLQCHISRIHKERGKFYCDYCGKGFTRKVSLKPHIWKHIGWEPFKCQTCDKSCDSNSHLQRHMMKHTGERPFQCQYCEYASTSKEPLNRHMDSHLNERKFKCELCPYSANRKDSLKRHLKNKCGTLTRKYTLTKSKVAIDFTLSHLTTEDSGPSTSV